MQGLDAVEDVRGILQGDFALVTEFDAEIAASSQAVLDLALEQIRDFLVEDLRRRRIAHVIAPGVKLRGIDVRSDNSLALNPQAVDIILKAQTRGEKRRKTELIIVTGHAAIHAPIFIGHNGTKIDQRIVIVQVLDLDLVFVLQKQVHKVDGVDVIGAGAKGLRDFHLGQWRHATGLEVQRVFPRKTEGGVGLQVHGRIDDVFAHQVIARQVPHRSAQHIRKTRDDIERLVGKSRGILLD